MIRRSSPQKPKLLVLAACAALAPGAQAADFFWSSGDFITGVTAPEPLQAGDTLFIQSGGAKRFVGSSFTNQGLVRWQADGLQGGNSASVTNGGTWQSESDANSLTWNFGGQPTFSNSGTYRKTAGSVTNVGTWNFVNNGGLIDAQVGAIVFNGDANTFSAGSRFGGAGQVRVTGGSAFNGAFHSDNLVFAGGSNAGSAARLSGGVAGAAGNAGWTGGDFTGSWAIASGSTMTASGATAKRQVGSQIVNDGTFRWATTTTLQGGNSSSFTNNGLAEVSENASITWNFGGQHTFTNNAGATVRATNTAVLTFGQVALTSHGGLFAADAGSAIVYSGDSNRFNSGTTFVGDHRVTGTSTYVGVITTDGLRWIAGTQLGGDGSPGSQASLAGTVRWEGGDLARSFVIDAGSTVVGEGVSAKRQVGSDIVNHGTFRWATTTTLQGGNSSSFTNNGLAEVSENASFTWSFGGQHAFTNNAGATVRATNTAVLTFGQVALTSHGGLFAADAGSAIVYSGDSNRFNGGTAFVGEQRMTGTSRFVDAIHSDNLRFVSGTQIGGDGSPGSRARLTGVAGFEGGDLSGAWRIESGATVTGSGAAAKRQVGSDIINDGTFRWATTTTLQGGNSSRLTNNGRFEMATDADMTWNFGGQAALDNNGLFIKTAGAGSSSLAGLALANVGTMDVRSGTIGLPANFANAGRLTGTGVFGLSGTLTNNGRIAPGASPGTLTINGNLLQSSLGTLDTELEGMASHDLLLVNGNVSLNGTLALSCFGSCSLAVGDEVVILDATGQLTGTFAAMTMSGFGSGAFDVVYDLAADRVLLRVTEAVTAVPEPQTYALMLSGLAALGLVARRRRAQAN